MFRILLIWLLKEKSKTFAGLLNCLKFKKMASNEQLEQAERGDTLGVPMRSERPERKQRMNLRAYYGLQLDDPEPSTAPQFKLPQTVPKSDDPMDLSFEFRLLSTFD